MLPFVYKCNKCGFLERSQEPPSNIKICYKCGKVDIPLYSIDLDYIKPKEIVKLLENELIRRNKRRTVRVKLLWTDRTGQKTEVSKMTRLHVENIIRRVKKCISD